MPEPDRASAAQAESTGAATASRPTVSAQAAAGSPARSGEAGDDTLPEAVRGVLSSLGWYADNAPPGGTARERWESLAALVTLADDVLAGQPDADRSRWVAPEEIGHVVRFLVSPEASAVTGAAIPVYGRA